MVKDWTVFPEGSLTLVPCSPRLAWSAQVHIHGCTTRTSLLSVCLFVSLQKNLGLKTEAISIISQHSGWGSGQNNLHFPFGGTLPGRDTHTKNFVFLKNKKCAWKTQKQKWKRGCNQRSKRDTEPQDFRGTWDNPERLKDKMVFESGLKESTFHQFIWAVQLEDGVWAKWLRQDRAWMRWNVCLLGPRVLRWGEAWGWVSPLCLQLRHQTRLPCTHFCCGWVVTSHRWTVIMWTGKGWQLTFTACERGGLLKKYKEREVWETITYLNTANGYLKHSCPTYMVNTYCRWYLGLCDTVWKEWSICRFWHPSWGHGFLAFAYNCRHLEVMGINWK